MWSARVLLIHFRMCLLLIVFMMLSPEQNCLFYYYLGLVKVYSLVSSFDEQKTVKNNNIFAIVQFL